MISLLLLAAAASVSGDFDRDGRTDHAYVRVTDGISELVVRRANGQIVVVDRVNAHSDFYLEMMPPGDYRTECAKGLGCARSCATPILSVRGDALQFGTREASQAVALWQDGRFRVHWLSD